MRHIDLFSGIGGFALAIDNVFTNETIEHVFCDNDEFCQEVLKKHWPEAQIYGDIRTLTYAEYNGRYGTKNTESGIERTNSNSKRSKKICESKRGNTVWPIFDILTGGFPCQPFSQAGRRKGTADDRHLWPEMFRVIREFRPTWVIAENVRGLLTWNEGMVLEQVCTDLEGEGYEVQPIIIPAVAVGAPHRRDRVWFVAHRISEQDDGKRRTNKSRRQSLGRQEQATQQNDGTTGNNSTVRQDSDAPDTKKTISKRRGRTRHGRQGFTNESWKQNWLEVATRLCRVDDGIPKRLDRNPRLKALGNAIVPQVAEEIMRAIKYQSL